MKQINYKEEYRRLFSDYRKNSGTPDADLMYSARALIDRFPYCQAIHFIYASGLRDNPAALERYLPKISILAPQRENLHKTIHHPEKIILKGAFLHPVKPNPVQENNYFSGHSERVNGSVIEPDIETGEDESLPAESFFFESSFKPEISETDHESELRENKSSLDISPSGNYLQNISQESRSDKLSRYYDDMMPFTFLWWLNKTRKENADTYQPYISFKLDTTRTIDKDINAELNQQIMENIFHLQTPLDAEMPDQVSKTVEFKVKRKDEELIEKFIKEDPQIRPMQPDKISTENMARRSSEDLNNVVSETLARIYVEQMLFDKAIDAYKKLSLKFPEKNAYFADRISDLEKKIN